MDEVSRRFGGSEEMRGILSFTWAALVVTVLLHVYTSLPFVPWGLTIATLSGVIVGHMTEDILNR